MNETQGSSEELIGEVTHFFPHIPAAVLRLDAELKVGDTIHIKGHTTDFVQIVESMQIEHEPIQSAGPGDDVAIQISEKVREGDQVYKQV